jgi:hypothetical protein
MNRDELAESVREMKHLAGLIVQHHWRLYARDVPRIEVDAICNALGDISIDEATAALDRHQREIHGDTERCG